MRYPKISWLVVAALLAGCSPDSNPLHPNRDLTADGAPGLTLSLDRESYGAGDEIRLRLSNASSGPIGYNACLAARERREGQEWRRYETLRFCTAAIYTVEPGESTSFVEPVTPEWQPGSYRIVLGVVDLDGEARFELRSPAFSVES